MDQLAHYTQQVAELVRQHLPAEALSASLPTAIAALVFGVAVCVLGALLARWIITVTFAVGGLVAGFSAGGHFDLAPIVVALIGAVVLGGVGFMLHRFWVGIATGLFLATFALGVVSTKYVFPHVDEFRQQQTTAAEQEVTDFQPGPVSDALHAGWGQFWSMTSAFREFIVQKEPRIERYGVIAVVLAGGLGLLMGIFLCRVTLILFTAAFGTSLIAAGMAMLGGHVHVNMLEMCQQRPEMSAAALASFFVFSIILQTLLTRGDKTTGGAKNSD